MGRDTLTYVFEKQFHDGSILTETIKGGSVVRSAGNRSDPPFFVGTRQDYYVMMRRSSSLWKEIIPPKLEEVDW